MLVLLVSRSKFCGIRNPGIEQAYFAGFVSFVWVSVQACIRPYRFPEDNILKFASEFAILTTILSTLAMKASRANGSFHVISEDIYTRIIGFVVLVLVPGSFFCAVAMKSCHRSRGRMWLSPLRANGSAK